MYRRLTEAAAAVPGVAHAAASVVTPVSGSTWNTSVTVPGAPDLPDNQRNSLFNYVTPGWFATYGTRIVEGRDVDGRPTAVTLRRVHDGPGVFLGLFDKYIFRM